MTGFNMFLTKMVLCAKLEGEFNKNYPQIM